MISLFRLQVLFSQFRSRDVLIGVCLLTVHKLCTLVQVDSATFSGATSHGLQWKNKTYKLKSSVVGFSTHYQGYRKSQLEISLETLRSRSRHFTANLTANCGLRLTVSRVTRTRPPVFQLIRGWKLAAAIHFYFS